MYYIKFNKFYVSIVPIYLHLHLVNVNLKLQMTLQFYLFVCTDIIVTVTDCDWLRVNTTLKTYKQRQVSVLEQPWVHTSVALVIYMKISFSRSTARVKFVLE